MSEEAAEKHEKIGGFRLHQQCEAAVDEVLRSVNTIQYLIQSIEEISGKPFHRDRIKCVSLSNDNEGQSSGIGQTAAAGYMWHRVRKDCDRGDILLVEEHMSLAQSNKGTSAAEGATSAVSEKTLQEVERNLRHELIHAFDDARGIIEASDCTHQACSEIRAARLSGDCFVGNELRRGRFDPLHSGMKCVRRRAALALEKNPVCRGFSDRAVERVFRRCYSDYEPFAAPIYAMGSYGDQKFDLKL